MTVEWRSAVSVSKERTVSLWMEVAVAPEAAPLTGHLETDVVVIGSGIAGLSAAYELGQRGMRVAVVDRGPIGMGQTARTTAHLASDSDDSFAALIETRGLDMAKLFYQSQAAAIDRIEAVQTIERIACNFRRVDGVLFPGLGHDPAELDGERDAARKIGIPVTDTRGLPFAGLEKTRCLTYDRQATFHPLLYLRGLAAAITAKGSRLHADTAVESVEEKDGRVAVKCVNGATISARHAVVATNSPIADWVAIHSKQGPYRTYAMAFALPRGTLHDALYWDTHDPYHYVRLDPGPDGGDYLIVGGEDHKTGEADDGKNRFEALEAWTRALVPSLGRETHRWSGQCYEPIDGCGFMGRNPGNENVYIITGDSGQGITHGVAGALMIADLILTGKSPWTELYEPARKPLSAIKQYVTENITAIKSFAEYISPGELGSVDELPPGRGAVIRAGLGKVAAFRDEHGQLHVRSAKCSHLGCVVHWNSTERCWDCPCHGSQFGIDGEVLNAPAISPLAPAEK